jgi:hypothetical protein
MKENERTIVGGLVVLLLILWLGFAFHRSPRFAGSLAGGVLAVTGSALMLVPLAYLVIKRIKPLKNVATARVSMRTLLAIHVYAGVLGPILVLLHTGHKFESHLGIALTAMTLIVVVSGFTGRYLMNQFSETIHEKMEMLTRLELAYRATAAEVAAKPEYVAVVRPFSGFFSRVFAGMFLPSRETNLAAVPAPIRALRLAQSMADLEYAIKTHEAFKRAFRIWLKLHIVLSFTLYALLGLHVWSSIHFGLRWFA